MIGRSCSASEGSPKSLSKSTVRNTPYSKVSRVGLGADFLQTVLSPFSALFKLPHFHHPSSIIGHHLTAPHHPLPSPKITRSWPDCGASCRFEPSEPLQVGPLYLRHAILPIKAPFQAASRSWFSTRLESLIARKMDELRLKM